MTEAPSMREALEQCPFCGGRAQWVEDTGALDTPFGLVVEHAEDCFLVAPMLGTWDQIITAWNTRQALSASPPTDATPSDSIAMPGNTAEAVKAFLAKYDECAPHITDAFLHRSLRCGDYTGPNFADELAALRALFPQVQK